MMAAATSERTENQSYSDEEEEITRRRPWSDLQEDLLRLVLKNLSFTDWICFRAVCKSWSLTPSEGLSPINEKLPWVLSYQSLHSKDLRQGQLITLELFNPFHRRRYKLHIELDKISDLAGAEICASQNGWLLFGRRNTFFELYLTTSTSLFLFNPFTKEFIKLPVLGFGFNVATFSAASSSQGCLIFAAGRTQHGLEMSTYRCGDQKWSSSQVIPGFPGRPVSSVYTKGKFYCVSVLGWLGCFNVAEQEWTMPVEPGGLVPSGNYKYLLESGGEVILVTVNTCSNFNRCWNTFRLDWSEMSWVADKSLENWALFVSEGVSCLVSVQGGANNLANRICYFGGNIDKGTKPRCYSIKDDEHDMKLENYDWIGSYCLESHATWIKPPYIQ